MSALSFGRHTISWVIGDSQATWGFFTGDANTMEFYNSRGDVNMDGNITIADVTALIDYLLDGDDSVIDLAAADTNLEGNVTIADVTTLIDYLLGGTW